jgi:hypothetical protein
VAVEVAGHGGAVDVELDGELADGGASLVGLNEVVDVGGGEAALGRVRKPSLVFSRYLGVVVGGSNLGGFAALGRADDLL